MSGTRTSFDVFDTALTRTFARPVDLFARLGREWDPARPERWKRRRVEAERAARRRSAREEVTLEDIYERLARKLAWTDAQKDQALAAELALERESLRPVPEIRERVERSHREGRPVLFISDTYKPASFLRDMLERNGLWKEGDRLYASSEEGVTKRSGGLFRVALDRERLRAGELLHIGDNDVSDVLSARRSGLEAELFTGTRLNRHERALAEGAELDRGLRSRMAAASRLARLSRFDWESPTERTLWEVGASVIGPMLTGYVAWCLREAGRNGVRRLYFVSRDGQVLLRIAEALRRSWNLDIECRYLHGSRQAWHLPALTELDEAALGWIFDSTLVMTVESVLRRVGFDAGCVASALAENGFAPGDWHRDLDAAGRGRLRELLTRDPLRSAILAVAEARRRTATGYLRQEGLMDSVGWALVDMGWSGRMQRSLRALLDGMGADRPVTGFYFALNGSCPAASGDRLFSYLDPAGFAATGLRHVPILETMAAADHGSVLGYQREPDGRFGPVLRPRPLESRNFRWARVQQGGAVAFAEQFGPLVGADEASDADLRGASMQMVRRFCGGPAREEARAYRVFRAGEDQVGGRLWRISTRIEPGQYWGAVLRGGKALYRLRWPEGCVAGSLGCPRVRIALLHLRQALGGWKRRLRKGAGRR